MGVMFRRCLLACALPALAGCGLRSATAPTSRPAQAPGEATGEVARLQGRLRQRELRIKELEAQVGRLSGRLRSLEFRCEQLRKQLQAVGDAPAQRDHYQKLSIKQALEIQELRRRIDRLLETIARGQVATAPASRPGPRRRPD